MITAGEKNEIRQRKDTFVYEMIIVQEVNAAVAEIFLVK